MDGATYVLLNSKVKKVSTTVSGMSDGFTYKGSVATTSDLPASPSSGDMYTVSGIKYVYDGSDWVMIDAIDSSDIDALYT